MIHAPLSELHFTVGSPSGVQRRFFDVDAKRNSRAAETMVEHNAGSDRNLREGRAPC